MKFLIVFACALAAASAGHILAPVGHAHVYAAGYHGPQHLPIIDHEGVPVDTADVQVAKAAHLSHKVNVAARNGDLAIGHHVAPVVAAYAAPAVAHSAVVAHAAPLVTHSAVVAHGHHGVLTHAAPLLAHGNHGVLAHGTPIVAAHHGVLSHHGLLYRKRRGIYAATPLAIHHGYLGAQHLPLIDHEGVPVDTADVQVARAAHLAHKVNVHHRNGDHAIVAHAAPIVAAHTTYAHTPVVAHHAYAHAPVVAHHAHAYAAPWAHVY